LGNFWQNRFSSKKDFSSKKFLFVGGFLGVLLFFRSRLKDDSSLYWREKN
jgi:hypothetical protein